MPMRNPKKTMESSSDKSAFTPPPQRDRSVENAQTILGIYAVPMFTEIWERGRGNIAQFARDFLDIDITAHKGQMKWVHTFPWATERILSTGNRWGKDHINAVKMGHHALYQTRLPKYAEMTDRYKVISLSLTIDMARIPWLRLFNAGLQNKLFRRFILEDECRRYPFPEMVIGSNRRGASWKSYVVARSSARDAQYLLSQDYDFVVWNEAAREPKGPAILDDVLRMRLVDRDGRLDMTSTGDGKNWFFELFENYLRRSNSGVVYAQTGTSFENPFISHARLRANMKRMGEEWVRQNIMGGFAGHSATFERDYIKKCYADNDWHIWENPNEIKAQENWIYYGGIDFARKKDATVILVAGWESPEDNNTWNKQGKLVYAQEIKRGTAWEEQFRTIAAISRAFRNPPFLIDSTGMAGDIILDTLRNDNYRVNAQPYEFTKAGKEQLILVTQQYIQEAKIIWPYIPPLYDQLCGYDRMDEYLQTDWVFAYALLCENHRRATSHEQMPTYVNLSLPVEITQREFTGDVMELIGASNMEAAPLVIHSDGRREWRN